MEVDLQSLLALISGRLKTLIFQWVRIEARVCYIFLYLRRHKKLIVNAAVAILEV